MQSNCNPTSIPQDQVDYLSQLLERGCPGRPKGSTSEKKRKYELHVKDIKQKIVLRYVHATKVLKDNILSKKRLYERIHEEEKLLHNLPHDFDFSYKTVLSRISHNLFAGDGYQCPLIDIEQKIIDLIICMSKIKRSLTVSEGLNLVNDLIKDTDIQKRLIKWKMDHKIYRKNFDELGKVGKNWWNNFLSRNKHLLRSKSGKKYGYDRTNFSTYLNFADTYDHIKDILVSDSKIASKFDQPIWMDKCGNVVDKEEDSFGCKVPIHLHRPDMGIVMDEVGCDISQEHDKSKGGQLYMCGKSEEPYQSIATKAKHFTCLGLTLLNGDALMCVIIIQGKKRDVLIESGVDWEKLKDLKELDSIVDGNEYEFFFNHFGQDKLFPGGPVCKFKGVDVPAYIDFSESGGITGTILTNIFRHLDELKIYHQDRSNGFIPFVPLDGHQTRFDLEFLNYINDDDHLWNVTLGVPYGTALWQVGDSSEQNGIFKMLLAEKKAQLFGNRINTMQQKLNIMSSDIVPLVNACWPLAFANVTTNKKAISERGWMPYNRVLLLNELLQATITEEMIVYEKKSNLFGPLLIKKYHKMHYAAIDGNVNMIKSTVQSFGDKSLNFQDGKTAQYVSTTILTESDCQVARQRSQKLKEEGSTLKHRISNLKNKITSTKMTIKLRQYGLKQNIRDHVRSISEAKIEKDTAKQQCKELAYLKNCYKADKVIEKHANEPNACKWKSKSDIITLLRPLKEAGEPAFPKSREAIEALCVLWQNRKRKTTSSDENVLKLFHKWIEDETSSSNKNRGK